MDTKLRITDINTLSTFNDTEVELYPDERENTFASIEFYIIFHYTNEGLFYLSDEETKNLEYYADEILDTPKGRIFCYK